jgi:hypothetical protein
MAKKKSGARNGPPAPPANPNSTKGNCDRLFPETLLSKHDNQVLHLEDLIPNAVFVARNALSSKECEDWINYAENNSGWDVVAHPATKWIAHRECSRIQKNDWTMAHRLFTRIQQIVIDASKQLDIFDKSSRINSSYENKSYQPVTCNPNLRLYKYTKGQWFGRHIDDTNKIEWKGSDTPYTDVSEAQTEITVLFYLSTCRGGATRFHLPNSTKRKGSKGDDGSVAFAPTQGAVLLHVHGDKCLEHEAEAVVDGIKYVLRTDIVYGVC